MGQKDNHTEKGRVAKKVSDEKQSLLFRPLVLSTVNKDGSLTTKLGVVRKIEAENEEIS